jgi:hypothetical protein
VTSSMIGFGRSILALHILTTSIADVSTGSQVTSDQGSLTHNHLLNF